MLHVVGGWLYLPLQHDQDPDLCQDAVRLPVILKAWPSTLPVKSADTADAHALMSPCCVSQD